MKTTFYGGILLLLISCSGKEEKIHPEVQPITESIYASGIIKSKDQYSVYPRVNGTINEVFVKEGDSVFKGMPILTIYNEAQRLNQENAMLAANYYDFNANREKLEEAKWQIELAQSKLENDSIMYYRQKKLFEQGVGTEVEFEQSELAFTNSKTTLVSAKVRYDELKRQLDFNSAQAKKQLMISGSMASDYTVVSAIDGIIYSLNKTRGEMISVQTELAVIGDPSGFILEMQVDEDDILYVKPGLKVLVTLDSYEDQVFEARVTRVIPWMNQRSKTFVIEAEFVNQPEILYPNMNFEANIIIQSKEEALVIPRRYVLNDSIVMKSNGDKVAIKTGLMDYQFVEVLSGITREDELIIPAE